MTEPDLHARLAEALTREHYRRAAAKIEASPEDHQRGFAGVAMEIVGPELAQRDAENARLRTELSFWRQQARSANRASADKEWARHEAVQRAERAEAKVTEYENALTWQTTCTGCAATLDAAASETFRAERAEAENARTRVRDHLRKHRRYRGVSDWDSCEECNRASNVEVPYELCPVRRDLAEHLEPQAAYPPMGEPKSKQVSEPDDLDAFVAEQRETDPAFAAAYDRLQPGEPGTSPPQEIPADGTSGPQEIPGEPT